MNKLKKIWLWYCMFNKRLFRKASFLILLCMIPLLIPISNVAMQGESGILTIVLCDDGKDAASNEIINALLEEEGVILFRRMNTPEQAIEAVEQSKADAAWIFASHFKEQADAFARKENTQPLVTVYERESTIPLQLSREKLVGALYPNVSLGIYKNHIKSQVLDGMSVEDEKIEAYYNKFERRRDVVVTEYINDVPMAETNYLTAPFRGMLAVLILLCGFAAVLYYLKDRADGKFDWMTVGMRSIPAFASCFSAIMLAGIAVMIALYVAGLAIGIFVEIAAMLLFVLMTSGFCLCLCLMFKSITKFGAVIPALLIVTMILSPIFIDLNFFGPVRMLLPTYHYLQAIYNPMHLWNMLVYCVIVYALAALLSVLRARNER